jgi:hypothetical protein
MHGCLSTTPVPNSSKCDVLGVLCHERVLHGWEVITTWHADQRPAHRLLCDANECLRGAPRIKAPLVGEHRILRQPEAMAVGHFSNTTQEVRGVAVVLEKLMRTDATVVVGRLLQIWGDNQAAIADSEHMYGRYRCMAGSQAFVMSSVGGWEVLSEVLSLVWRPSTRASLQLAGAMSEQRDLSGSRLLRKKIGEQVCRKPTGAAQTLCC